MNDVWMTAFAPGTLRDYQRSWSSFLIFLEVYTFACPSKYVQLNEDLSMAYGLWRFKNDGVAKRTIRKDVTRF